MTLRELLWMAEAKGRAAWAHTSSVMALIFNVNRGKGTPPARPERFNPYLKGQRKMRGIPLTVENLRGLKPAFKKGMANATQEEAADVGVS